MLKMTLFYGKKRVLSSNKMVNSAAVFTLAAIVLASTFASVNGQDSRVTTWGSLALVLVNLTIQQALLLILKDMCLLLIRIMIEFRNLLTMALSLVNGVLLEVVQVILITL